MNIPLQRLQRQCLSTTKFRNPGDVVRWFGAMQAQDYPGAKWAVGQRLLTGTDAQVEKSFNDGDILRTHVMRPTWHFVAPDDIRWLLELTAPRVRVVSNPYLKKFGLDKELLKKAEKALIKSLRGNNYSTRAELRDVVERAGIKPCDSVRFGHILLHAELEGLICSGPRKGKQFTYALLSERERKSTAKTADESVAELTRRYFRSHGPATLHDFVWWSGLTVASATRGIEINHGNLDKLILGDRTLWDAGQDAKEPVQPLAHLLPAFDEYLVSYKNRSDALHPNYPFPEPESNPIFAAHVAIGGRLVGSWKRTVSKDSVALEVHPFGRLSRIEWLAIENAVEKYGDFLGLKASIKRV